MDIDQAGTACSKVAATVSRGVVVDDATETVHAATVRQRETPHGGDSPRASAVATDE